MKILKNPIFISILISLIISILIGIYITPFKGLITFIVLNILNVIKYLFTLFFEYIKKDKEKVLKYLEDNIILVLYNNIMYLLLILGLFIIFGY